MDASLERVGSGLVPTDLYDRIAGVLDAARNRAYTAVNFAMVQAYWEIGRSIVEEQGGEERAEYGNALIINLSEKLTADYGKGFDERNLRFMRRFYAIFPIRNALRSELTWTHCRLLCKVKDEDARLWYMNEAANEHWSSRQLDRQISTLYYVIIDLKVGKLTHTDVGQMDSYIRMFDALQRRDDDNPTIGLILCSEKNEAVARYSALADGKQLFASKYVLELPSVEELEAQMENTRREFEANIGSEG